MNFEALTIVIPNPLSVPSFPVGIASDMSRFTQLVGLKSPGLEQPVAKIQQAANLAHTAVMPFLSVDIDDYDVTFLTSNKLNGAIQPSSGND